MGPQLLLQLEPPKLRTSDLILGMLRERDWWTPWEISDRLRFAHHIQISDSNITARLREMRLRFGKDGIVSRPRAETKRWEYRIVE